MKTLLRKRVLPAVLAAGYCMVRAIHASPVARRRACLSNIDRG